MFLKACSNIGVILIPSESTKDVTLLENPSRIKADCAGVMPAPTYLFCETDSKIPAKIIQRIKPQVFQPPILGDFFPIFQDQPFFRYGLECLGAFLFALDAVKLSPCPESHPVYTQLAMDQRGSIRRKNINNY